MQYFVGFSLRNVILFILVSFPLHETLLDASEISVITGTLVRPQEGETHEQLRERVRTQMIALQAKLPPVKMPKTSAKAIEAWKKKHAAKSLKAS